MHEAFGNERLNVVALQNEALRLPQLPAIKPTTALELLLTGLLWLPILAKVEKQKRGVLVREVVEIDLLLQLTINVDVRWW